MSHTWAFGLKAAGNRISHACSTARIADPMNSVRSRIRHFQHAVSFPSSLPSYFRGCCLAFIKAESPPEAFIAVGVSLNPFLSLGAGLAWLCQAYQSSLLIFVAEKTVSSVVSGVPQAPRSGILMYFKWHMGGDCLKCVFPLVAT